MRKMFKHLEDFKVHMNNPIEDEWTIRVLNMFYATVLFALIGFPVKWCALGFAGYIYTEAMRFESEQRSIIYTTYLFKKESRVIRSRS